MPVLGDTISTASIALADLSDVATTSDVQIAHLGIGVAEGATARITLPATASLAGGIDFGGTASLQYVSAGKVKFERPSGGASIFDVNAATGQTSALTLSVNGTQEFRFMVDTSLDLTLQNSAVVGSPYAIQNKDVIWVDQSTNSLRLQHDATNSTNTTHFAVHVAQRVYAWDGGSTDGAAITANRDRIRVYGEHLSGFANSTNGNRTGGDDATLDNVLVGGQSGFQTFSARESNWNAKGSCIPFVSVISGIAPHTAHPNSYAESGNILLRIEAIASKGTYAGNLESLLDVDATGAGGPIRGFGALLNMRDDNLYSSYSAANLGAGSQWIPTGVRGLWIHSSGTGYCGTGILLKGTGGSSETTPPSGFKRAFVLEDRAAAEIFCIDGAGNIGVRRSTNQSTTLAAALTVGYTAAGAESTVPADGIMFGDDTNLYRVGADVLKTDDTLHVGATFRHLGSVIGFLNGGPNTKQTVTGSRGANAALASLLTALASYGLITDSSS